MTMFTEAFHQYKYWCTKRREELTELVGERTGHSIVAGPFKGMIILPRWSWGDGDHVPKLLGTYESELYNVAEEQVASKPDYILNVGCAEGFWGLGMAMRTGAPALLIDVHDLGLEIAQENATVNNLKNIEYSNESTTAKIDDVLSKHMNPFLIMDCEGAEDQLLDLNFVPNLKHTTILLESHDCFIPGLTNRIKERFADTHTVMEISQGAKNPYIDIIKDLGDHDKMLLCIESRAMTMSWLYLVPKV